MPRPTSKTQLLVQSEENHDKLIAYLDTLTPEEFDSPNTVGEWAVKDVLAHLTAWEQMVLDWYRTGKAGGSPITPAEGYTWREIPALNQHIYEQHCDDSAESILADFHASYTEIMDEIRTMTNDELFTPKVYAWTKSTTLGSYATSCTSSHYDWALREIRRGIRAKQKAT